MWGQESGLTNEYGTTSLTGSIECSIKTGGLLIYIKMSIFPVVRVSLAGLKCQKSGLTKDGD